MNTNVLISKINDQEFQKTIKTNVISMLYKKKNVLVVMPTYNRPDKCINVIKCMLSQIYKDFDLLIVDDGSSEDNYDKLLQHVNKLGKRQVILQRNVENIKVAKTLNNGLRYFLQNEYKYFTWISDDNEYYPDFINSLVRLNADFVYTTFHCQYMTKKITKIDRQYKDVTDLLKNFGGCASFMWSREAVQKIGFYDENIPGPEDYDYLIRTFINVDNRKYSNVSNMKYILHDDCLSVKDKVNVSDLSRNIKLIYEVLTKNDKHYICKGHTDAYDRAYLKIRIDDNNVTKYDEEKNELVVSKIYENIVKNYENTANTANTTNTANIPNISIVMAYYNRKEQIIRTLDGFEKQYAKKYNFEVVIVDDNSNEENILNEVIKKYSFSINLIRINTEEKGNRINSCMAYNKGFKKASGDIIIIQNPECYHVGDIIKYTLNNLKEQNYITYSCFSANNSDITHEMINSSDVHKLIANQDFLEKNLKDPTVQLHWYNHPTDTVHGGRQTAYHFCSAIHKCKLDLIGGFDERFSDGYCFDDDEILITIKYNLKLNISIIDPKFCFVIHQYHTRSDSLFMNNENLKTKKLLKNKKLFDEMKTYHENNTFKYPKLLHLYWDGSPMSFLNYITILSFNECHKFWKIIVYMPKKKTNGITWISHEQKLRYDKKCYLNDVYDIPNVIIKEVCLDEIGFYDGASEVIKSDYFRYYILQKHGGLWSDFDIVYTANVEEKMNFNENSIIFRCFSHQDPKNKAEKNGYLYFPIGFFLCTPENTFFEYIRSQCIKNYDKNEYQSIGAVMWGNLFPSNKDIYDIDESTRICDEKYYLPWAWNELYEIFEKKDNILPNENVGIHWFNGATQSKQYAIDLSQRIATKFYINTYIDKFVDKYIQYKKISIVMAYFNRREQLINTIKSIEKSNYKNIEVIIVDDCSNEDEKVKYFINEINKNIFVKLITIDNKDEKIVNPCVAYNIGFKHATGDIIVIQNPEIMHVYDCLQYVANNLEHNNLEHNEWLTLNCYGSPGFQYNEILYAKTDDELFSLVDESNSKIGGNSIRCDDVGGWLNHHSNHFVAYHYFGAIHKRDLFIKMGGGFADVFKHGIGGDDDEFIKRLIYNKFNFKINKFGKNEPFAIHQFHKKPKSVKNRNQYTDNRKLFNDCCLKMGFVPQNDIALAPQNEIPMYRQIII
jgi:glycosyltransferase involved in cell wall biosynthesis